MRTFSILAAMLLLLGSCRHDGPTAAAGGLSIEINPSAISHEEGGSRVLVPYALQNQGATPIFLAGCDGTPLVEVERLSGGSWFGHPDDRCDGVPGSVSISPGGVILGGKSVPAVPGMYRLAIGFGSSVGTSQPPRWRAVSDTYEYWPFLIGSAR